MKKIIIFVILILTSGCLFSCTTEEVIMERDERKFRIYFSSDDYGFDKNGEYDDGQFVINTYKQYLKYKENEKNIFTDKFKDYNEEDFENMTLYVINEYLESYFYRYSFKRIEIKDGIGKIIIETSGSDLKISTRLSIWYEGKKNDAVKEISCEFIPVNTKSIP